MTDSASIQAAEADPVAAEASPDYDLTRLLILARLLTSDPEFLATDAASVETLLNLPQAPSCDADSGPYVDLLAALKPPGGAPPTYVGANPVDDITMTLRQLAMCQRSTTQTLIGHVADIFMHRDGGKTLRELLLFSKIVIELLCLWKVLRDNELLGDDVEFLQAFGESALQNQGISKGDVTVLPDEFRTMITQAQAWDNDMTSLVATFSVGTINPAPVLLPFLPTALEAAMQAMESSGKLTRQQGAAGATQGNVDGSSGDDEPSPDSVIKGPTFLAANQLRQFVAGYVASGAVKPQPPVYEEGAPSSRGSMPGPPS